MNRIAGIIVAVVGLIIAVLSVLKISPALTSTGVSLILLGVLMIGLSFVRKPEGDETTRMSTPATLAGIFYAPTEVFQNLRRHPRWLVAVLVMSVLSAVYFNAFLYRLTPERVTNYSIDKTLEMPMMNDDARKNIEAGRADSIEANKNPILRTGQAINGFVAQVFLCAFLGAIFLLFALAMGGQINYWQAFAVAAYASFPVAVIRFVLNTIILFIKDPTDVHPIIGQGSLIQDSLNFLVTPAQSPVLYSLLGAFSLLSFYWIWLNGTGLKNAGERVSSTIAWSATLAVFFLGVVLSVLAAFLFSGFIS